MRGAEEEGAAAAAPRVEERRDRVFADAAAGGRRPLASELSSERVGRVSGGSVG